MSSTNIDRHVRHRLKLDAITAEPRRRALASLELPRALRKARPTIVRVGADRSSQLLKLRLGEQRRVVSRMSLRRQTPRLYRVGEDDGRAVHDRVRLRKCLCEIRKIMATEVPHGSQQTCVLDIRD